MEVILFLDDCRKPDQVKLPRSFMETVIISVSTYEDAIAVFMSDNYEVIGLSLDYDLNMDVVESTGLIALGKFNNTEYTGLDFLNFVFERYKRGETNKPRKGIYIHSQNYNKADIMRKMVKDTLGEKYLISKAT